MGASRENMSIWRKNGLSRVRQLIVPREQWEKHNRTLIILDSFKTPFYKIIGCKALGHKWEEYDDFGGETADPQYICWKCFNRKTKSEVRVDKLNKLKIK